MRIFLTFVYLVKLLHNRSETLSHETPEILCSLGGWDQTPVTCKNLSVLVQSH